MTCQSEEFSSDKYHVALYGGSFDPFTIAHEALCQKVHEHTGLNVWVMPCWNHFLSKSPSDATHRWKMLQLVSKRRPCIVPLKWEIENKHHGSMYDTLRKLNELYQDTVFHIVIGMDNANIIKSQWNQGEALVLENRFIVVARKGHDPMDNWFLNPPHRFLEMESDISSTDVRKAISSGAYQRASEMVSEPVWQYIKEHRLYGY